MNQIFAFLRKYFHVLLFLGLETFCIFLIINYNSYLGTVLFNSSQSFVGKILQTQRGVTEYFGLQKTNEALVIENISLRKKLNENFYVQNLATTTVSDTIIRQRYQYITAEVLNSTTDKAQNYLTLNCGTRQGIKKGMGVFGPEGVVGIIYDASENFSLAISVLNPKCIISPKIKELNYSDGSAVWDGNNADYIIVNGINKYEPIQKGFHVVTSPFSKNFPENIPIGTIDEIVSTDESFYKIKVKLSTEFSKIRQVYVVKDLFKDELEELEQKVIE